MGSDRTGSDWPATSWEGPATEISAADSGRLSACRNTSRGRGLSGAQGRADRLWKRDGVSRSDSALVQYRSTLQLSSSLFEVRQHARRFSRQVGRAEISCSEVESTTLRHGREHNLQAETLSTPSKAAWRVSCGGGFPKSTHWKPLPPDEISARQELQLYYGLGPYALGRVPRVSRRLGSRRQPRASALASAASGVKRTCTSHDLNARPCRTTDFSY